MTMTETSPTETTSKDGRVVGIAGPVIDVEFPRGALPELIRDGVDGVVVRAGVPTALARALHDVDRDPQRWRAMGQAGKDSYAGRFEASESVAQLLDIYDFAIRNGVGARV